MIANNLIDTFNRLIFGSLDFSSVVTRVLLDVHTVFQITTSLKIYSTESNVNGDRSLSFLVFFRFGFCDVRSPRTFL